jgi:mRNA-degrading endonuclease RelE of RelBE toxin-antitoxin system
MEWDVKIIGKVGKQAAKLPNDVNDNFLSLILELRVKGGYLPHRPNFGKIKGEKDAYHCHLHKGHPTYVACWQINKKENRIEVYYVGTHENAPY